MAAPTRLAGAPVVHALHASSLAVDGSPPAGNPRRTRGTVGTSEFRGSTPRRVAIAASVPCVPLRERSPQDAALQARP
eukprot:CAMPEP_0117558924 /NCGR_PEP_ID=MMETSP0784-20121206/53095_1 /TAXON_ID=39447 /ORGANISM="" /LENGTH=77 /DNA_ID=CAMNT_0005356285 /DNA_START=305 /DNA_END=534 /DNA_ORIENTATION=-